MSIVLGATTHDQAYRIAALAFGPQPDSALAALGEYGLSEKEKNAIEEILKNTSAYTRIKMQNRIFSILAPELCEEQKAAIEASPTNTPEPCEGQEAGMKVFHLEKLPTEIYNKILESCDQLKEQILPLSSTCNLLYGQQPQLCISMLKITKRLSLKELRLCQRILGVQPDTWNDVFIHCKQLQELDFSESYPEDNVIEYQPEIIAILMSAKEHCLLLTRFNFSGCYDMGPMAFEALLKGFPITSLNFSKMISNHLLCSEAIETIAKHCPHLRELDLSDNQAFENSPNDVSIQSLVKNCPTLTHLKIPCALITNDGLFHLHNCKNLVFLKLGWCIDISLEGVIELKKKLPNLKVEMPYEMQQLLEYNYNNPWCLSQ